MPTAAKTRRAVAQPDVLTRMLDDLGARPKLTREESEAMGRRITAGRTAIRGKDGRVQRYVLTPEALEEAQRLMDGNALLAVSWAKSLPHWGRLDGDGRAEMVLIGLKGLNKAAQHWDPDSGCPLGRWTFIKAGGELSHAEEYRDRGHRIPESQTARIDGAMAEVLEAPGDDEARREATQSLQGLYGRLLAWLDSTSAGHPQRASEARILAASLGIGAPPGSLLPTADELGRMFGLARGTIRHTLSRATRAACAALDIPPDLPDRRAVLCDLVRACDGYRETTPAYHPTRHAS